MSILSASSSEDQTMVTWRRLYKGSCKNESNFVCPSCNGNQGRFILYRTIFHILQMRVAVHIIFKVLYICDPLYFTMSIYESTYKIRILLEMKECNVPLEVVEICIFNYFSLLLHTSNHQLFIIYSTKTTLILCIP